MQIIRLKNNQALIDATMQVYGDAGALFLLAAEQGLSITALLDGGTIETAGKPVNAQYLSIAKILAGHEPASGDVANNVASITSCLPFVISLQLQPNGKVIQAEQCLVDLAMQYMGTAQDLFLLASSLGLSITEQLTAGDECTTPVKSLAAYERKITEQLNDVKNIPASGEHVNAVAGITSSLPFVISLRHEPNGKVAQYAQSLVDLAMQHLGDAADLFNLASSLGLSITTRLTAGDIYNMPAKTLQVFERKLIELLNDLKNNPASDIDADGPPSTVKLEGIDYWFVYEYIVQ